MRIYSSSVLRKYAEGMKSKSFIGTKHGPLKDDHLPTKKRRFVHVSILGNWLCGALVVLVGPQRPQFAVGQRHLGLKKKAERGDVPNWLAQWGGGHPITGPTPGLSRGKWGGPGGDRTHDLMTATSLRKPVRDVSPRWTSQYNVPWLPLLLRNPIVRIKDSPTTHIHTHRGCLCWGCWGPPNQIHGCQGVTHVFEKVWPKGGVSFIFSCNQVSCTGWEWWLVQQCKLEEDQNERVWKGMEGYERVWKGVEGFNPWTLANPSIPFQTLPNPSKTPSLPNPQIPPYYLGMEYDGWWLMLTNLVSHTSPTYVWVQKTHTNHYINIYLGTLLLGVSEMVC